MAYYIPDDLQTYISDPAVLTAVIEAQNYRLGRIKIEPNDPLTLMKNGKSPAAEAIAPVAVDSKLLTKLSKDNRRGVRFSFLRNPNLNQDHIEEVLRRSLKQDKDLEVAAKAAEKLDTDRLLAVLKDHVGPMSEWISGNDRVEYTGFNFIPRTEHYRADSSDMLNVLASRIEDGGVDYLRKLHAAGIENYAAVVIQGSTWYKPGMLAWMAAEMRPELVSSLLHNLLRTDTVVSLEDVKEAQKAIAGLPPRETFREDFSAMHSRLDPETFHILLDMGPEWEPYVRASSVLPGDIQAKFVNEMSDEQLSRFSAPFVPVEYRTWDVDMDNLDDEAKEFKDWVAPEVVNTIAERLHPIVLQQALLPGRGRTTSIVSEVRMRFGTLLWTVHPDHRKKLSLEALVLEPLSLGKGYGYGHRPQWRDPVSRWVTGQMDEKPTTDRVAELLVWAATVEADIYTITGALGQARRISLLLGEPLEFIGGQAFRCPEVVSLVFHHYFGTDAEAWRMAIELSKDWDGSITDLAETACAAVGRDVPTEVIDQADLDAAEAARKDAEAAAADDTPTDEIVEPDDEAVEPVEEEEDDSVVEESTEPVVAEETSTEPTSEDPVEDEALTDSEQPEEVVENEESSDTDDIVPLDITTAVQFSLF